MNNLSKEIICIVIISFLFSIIRYFFIEDEFNIIKKQKSINELSYTADSNIIDIKEYLLNINKPELVDFLFVKDLFYNEIATFIDARDYASYLESHIEGAINIPYEEIEFIEKEYDLIWINEQQEDFSYLIESFGNNFIIGLNNKNPFIRNPEKNDINALMEFKEKIFVIYCSGVGCSLSEDLAFYLSDNLKFKRILIFEGGMPIWEENNMPVR